MATKKKTENKCSWVVPLRKDSIGVLSINGTLYTVVPVGTDEYEMMNQGNGTWYSVDLSWGIGQDICDCDDMKYRGRKFDTLADGKRVPHSCKHCRALRAGLAHLEGK